MVVVHPEYVTDDKLHRRVVLLPLPDWERVIEELEELDDIRAFDAAKEGSQESVPFDVAVREIGQDYKA